MPAEKGKKSGGPQTASGKARVGRNALRHGLTSVRPRLLEWERPAEFRSLLEAMILELAPEGIVEALLVDRVVWCAWRLRRAARVEQLLLTGGAFDGEATSIVRVQWMDPDEIAPESARDPLVEARRAAAREAAALAQFGRDAGQLTRYETTLERSMYRALWELRATQDARRAGDTPTPRAPGFGR